MTTLSKLNGRKRRLFVDVESPSKKTKKIWSKLFDEKADDIILQPTCLNNATRPAEIIDGMNFGL